MNLIETLLPAIKPMIKRAFEQAESQIINELKNAKEEQKQDVVFILFEMNNKLIVTSAFITEEKQVLFSEELNKKIIEPQPLVPYIIKNFNIATQKK